MPLDIKHTPFPQTSKLTLVFANGERDVLDIELLRSRKPDFYHKALKRLQVQETGGKIEQVLHLADCPFDNWRDYYLPKLRGEIQFPVKKMSAAEQAKLDGIASSVAPESIKKAIFIKIPKNGTTSMKEILAPFPSIVFYSRNRSLFINQKRAMEARSEFPEAYGNSLSMAIVRNPYARAVSAWKYANLFLPQKLSFLNYLQKVQSNELPQLKALNQAFPQFGHLSDEKGNIIVDLILRLERIEEDFERVKEELNLPASLSYPKLNVTQSSPYQGQYTKETFDLVSSLYATDIAYFGYKISWDDFQAAIS